MNDHEQPNPNLNAGWYVILRGEETDLEDWRYTLNSPFEPEVFKDGRGRTILESEQFAKCSSAEEVRSRALVLISRLNGALALQHRAKPVRLGNVLEVDKEGNESATVFAEANITLGRIKGRATATVLDANGNPVPPEQPRPSLPQDWNALAEEDDIVSDLLSTFGNADNWIDLYKALEVAAEIVGSKHKLFRLAGEQAKACKEMHQTANYHRHAKATLPQDPPDFNEAYSMTAWLIQRVLEVAAAKRAANRN